VNPCRFHKYKDCYALVDGNECSFSTKEIASVLKKTFKMIKLLPSTTARIGS